MQSDKIRIKPSWFAKEHHITDTEFSHSAKYRIFTNSSSSVKKADYVAGKHIGETLMASAYNKRKARFYGSRKGTYLDNYVYKHVLNSPKKHGDEIDKDFRDGVKKAISDSFGKVLK